MFKNKCIVFNKIGNVFNITVSVIASSVGKGICVIKNFFWNGCPNSFQIHSIILRKYIFAWLSKINDTNMITGLMRKKLNKNLRDDVKIQSVA